MASASTGFKTRASPTLEAWDRRTVAIVQAREAVAAPSPIFWTPSQAIPLLGTLRSGSNVKIGQSLMTRTGFKSGNAAMPRTSRHEHISEGVVPMAMVRLRGRYLCSPR